MRFERRLAHSIEKAWTAVSSPEELLHWFPARFGVEELRAGARIAFTFPGEDEPSSFGKVLDVDPPRRLAFMWETDELRFELSPDGDGCLFVLTHVLAAEDDAAKTAAGWEVCLGELEKALAGEPAAGPGTEPTPEWRSHYEAYVAAGVPSGSDYPA